MDPNQMATMKTNETIRIVIHNSQIINVFFLSFCIQTIFFIQNAKVWAKMELFQIVKEIFNC